ncbi:hypothetical protein IAQ61_002310 [Plenodomus lingam]|uniref:Similar to MOSC domain containing protein n=1 Tax=Leptosphaeria maculans (strain JN3 / isolate v23.1.3 / race Av1-4-5-6-7-8) TaxID=985895 RepID=E4ZHK0_LEPMJ|nr:similar to MOSC domain containing protein [Plenodomus lingam JN3]KAH9876949.1 hypothetical protein IAQ61_002310 [Plenodomus lingam]CBX90833.1 similar to MOSC domain containing protein [Plenodomus lingam JN3]
MSIATAREHDLIDTIQEILHDAGLDFSLSTVLITLLASFSPLIILLALGLTQGNSRLPPPAGCRKLGLKGRSNLEDQYSKKYAKGAEATPAKPWTIKALFVYPVKSCAGVELEQGEVIRTGMKYDREFSFAQLVTSLPSLDGKVTSEWHFMTLRKFPRLAKVETEIWVPDPSSKDYREDGEWVKSEGCIVVRFPFSPDTDFSLQGILNYGKLFAARLARKSEPMLEFKIPFNPTNEHAKSKGYKHEVLKIIKDSPVALNVGSEIDPEILAKLRYTLGAANPITLFRIDMNKYREVHRNAPKKEDVGFQTVIGLQDDYPLHILNLASVHHLAANIDKQKQSKYVWQNHYTLLNALRFRANMYVTGPPAFDEDNWTKARISRSETTGGKTSVDLHISCRATRCKLPNVDPETGLTDRNEPLTTMRKYRIIDQGNPNPCLGMHVTPLEKGLVGVGDIVEILEKGEHYHLSAEGPIVHG